ncbi:hypothetical protein AX16_002354 [Volvariella volvacea WC 439]|nr:hypothetical protein AX16_002354 [Volvariella volvacea WC 439]
MIITGRHRQSSQTEILASFYTSVAADHKCSFIKSRFDRLQEAIFQSALPFAITAVLSDILIAAALCILLGSSKTEFEDTNSILNKLIIYAINHCILTCAVAIVEVIVFVAMPKSFYSFGIDFVFGKLYANSFLASLNSRRSLAEHYGHTTDMSTSLDLAPISSDHAGTLVRRDISRRVRSQDFGIDHAMSAPTHLTFIRDGKV